MMSNHYILKHHGILGMKWGVRRYQNKDGSLTEAGKKRLAKQEKRAAEKEEKTLQKKKKIVSNMDVEKFNKNIRLFSNDEIYAFKKRYEAEKEARHIGKNNSQERIDEIKKKVDNAGTLLSSYQKAASIVNNISGKEFLPEFNLVKKQEKAKKAKEKARNAYLQTLDPNDVLNNYKNFSTDDIAQLQKRFSNLELINKQKNLDAFKKSRKDNYKGYDTPIIETAPWGNKESPSAYFRSEIYDKEYGEWQKPNPVKDPKYPLASYKKTEPVIRRLLTDQSILDATYDEDTGRFTAK